MFALASTVACVSDELFQSPFNWREFVQQPFKFFLLAIGMIGFFLAGVDLVWLYRLNHIQETTICSQSPHEMEASRSAILVDVGGAVKEPGVYVLRSNQRLGEAIERAGGLTKSAHPAYVLHQLNLAAPLIDAQKIYIPSEEETHYCNGSSIVREQTAGQNDQEPSSDITLLVSINHATQAELESLPQIGEKRAEAIVAARPYQSLIQLLERQVVSETIFNEIRGYISL